MLDITRILAAIALAALLAADGFLLGGWPWTKPSSASSSAGGVVGVGAGFFVGCWRLGLWPRWPPTVDQARLIYILFPAIVLTELLAVATERFRWPAWVLRFVVALSAARVLLHDSVYLNNEMAEFDADTWTLTRTIIILGILSVALAGVWMSLVVLVQRTEGRSVPLAVSCTCAGAAVALLYSSSLTGGQMGLPLAAALAGATIASWLLPDPPHVEGILGLGIVGLFALLVSGRFFSDLTTGHALLLFFAPLLCWVPEMPYIVRLSPALRGILRIALTLVPIAAAVMLSRENFLSNDPTLAAPI